MAVRSLHRPWILQKIIEYRERKQRLLARVQHIGVVPNLSATQQAVDVPPQDTNQEQYERRDEHQTSLGSHETALQMSADTVSDHSGVGIELQRIEPTGDGASGMSLIQPNVSPFVPVGPVSFAPQVNEETILNS